MTDVATTHPAAMPVTMPSPVRFDRPDRLLLVEDPDAGVIPVRWRLSQSVNVWRCGACGRMASAACPHTFAAALFLARELLGLTPLATHHER